MALCGYTLRQFQLLYLPDKTLSHLDPLRLGNLMAIIDNLVQQFGVCRECDDLLLYGGVDESRLLFVALASTTVLPPLLVIILFLPVLNGKIDALHEDKFYTLFAVTSRPCLST